MVNNSGRVSKWKSELVTSPSDTVRQVRVGKHFNLQYGRIGYVISRNEQHMLQGFIIQLVKQMD